MTVFDMAKNLPASGAAPHFFCDNNLFEHLRDVCKPSESPPRPETLLGIRIEVIEDALERKAKAWAMSAATGHPVLYEDDQGAICQVSLGAEYDLLLPKLRPPNQSTASTRASA